TAPPRPLPSRPSAKEAEPLARERGQLADRLLPAEDPELAHVHGEVARKRSVRTGMRPLADEDPVAAAGVRRVRHDRAHVLLVADVGDARDSELLLDEELAEEVDRPPARLRGRVRHASPHPPGGSRRTYAADDDDAPVD